VAWKVLEGAAGGTITSAGLYTAPNAAGTFHVVATSAGDPSASATAAVTVSAPSTLIGTWTGTYTLSQSGCTPYSGSMSLVIQSGTPNGVSGTYLLAQVPNIIDPYNCTYTGGSGPANLTGAVSGTISGGSIGGYLSNAFSPDAYPFSATVSATRMTGAISDVNQPWTFALSLQ
jgi:hypothetical protein